MVWYISNVVQCVLRHVKLLTLLVVLVAVFLDVSVQVGKWLLEEDVEMLLIVEVNYVLQAYYTVNLCNSIIFNGYVYHGHPDIYAQVQGL